MGFDFDRSEVDHFEADQWVYLGDAELPAPMDHQVDGQSLLVRLDEGLATELLRVLRYRRHYFSAEGPAVRTATHEFLALAQDKQECADRIAERIAQLGGEPNFDPATLEGRGCARYTAGLELEAMIEEDAAAARAAVQTYRDLADYLDRRDDATLCLLAYLAAVEEGHTAKLRRILQQLRDRSRQPAPRPAPEALA